ncbi:transcription factor HIVEP3 [Trichomycterus rosablanca]|uniref:transcription factor HIVEP3 n=1 Tax=Trichomycterus rosablanca TaxID=2290929 RepID=UPI002F354511
MEVSQSQLSTGDQAGGQEHSQEPQHDFSTSNPQPSKAQPSQPKQTSAKRLYDKKRSRLQRKKLEETDCLERGKSEKSSGGSKDKKNTSSQASTTLVPTMVSMEVQGSTPKQKRERKPQKPGKYVCTYCGRACAKPSVLQKHIRSHTGERPYPCAPCGFSFKTKSNLYKHRKSHTHKVKAGMVSSSQVPGMNCLEDQVTESDEETGLLSSSLTLKNQEGKSCKEMSPEGQSQSLGYSHAVKKRLAMRLSRGKRSPMGSTDESSSSFGLSSKGSTESGYFSRSESTDVPQESATSAKSYAEVILGKFGRLGHLQRTVRQQHDHPAEQEGRSIPFSVPKKQVIDHITKLITINEAVVDTSKIDSVKPRRCPFSRKSSIESTLSKEPILCGAKEINSKISGSITLGVPCEKFQQHSVSVRQPADTLCTAPLLRSHSLPSGASSESAGPLHSLRLSHSFDDPQPAPNRRHGMLRRQPAIELPIGAEITSEEEPCSSLPLHPSISVVPECEDKQAESFECELCRTACSNLDTYKTHKLYHCSSHTSHQLEIPVCQTEGQGTFNITRPGALSIRKRRKEESLELEDPNFPSVASSSSLKSQEYIKTFEKTKMDSSGASQAHEKENTLKAVSVIQHTSLINKIEPTSPHQTMKPTVRKLVRQENVQVPEILITEEPNISLKALFHQDVPESKETKKVEDFQWPQRSPSLAQLPIEKLPPKKKRLRLAEAAQSSGDSSFESCYVPQSPSQKSYLSSRSSHSTLVEETAKSDRSDVDMMMSRRSRALHTLTIPTSTHHPRREMHRSASEQAPHISQQINPTVDTRSKSFDYGCLSPDRTAAGWRERRKCLLIKHSAVKEPEEEDLPSSKPMLDLNPSTIVSRTHSPDTSHSSELSKFSKISLATAAFPTTSQKTDALTRTEPHPVMESPQSLTGAARAHYCSVSTGLKLEIPIEDDVGQSVSSLCSMHLARYHHPNIDITPSPELLRPLEVQRVPVRLHSDLPSHATFVYTTLSQTSAGSSQDPSCSGVELDCKVLKFDPEDQQSAGEGSKSCSSGGNKRVLSPTSSVEFNTESQQQKRVKEEEKDEDGTNSKVGGLIASKGELCTQNVMPPIDKKETVLPSLGTNLTISWCYLNYIKPNPSVLSDNQSSVYSTWCVSTRNPNPPGLTSKEVLSLINCKQRHSSFTYTMASMPSSTVMKPVAPDSKEPKGPEVNVNISINLQSQKSPTKKENILKQEGEEEPRSTSKYEIPRVQICEGGYRSSEEYVYVRGRGRGRYVCEECGIRCKKPSMLRKHIRLHTDARPYVCQHCNFAFKTKGNLTKHMKSKAHGKRCPEGTPPGPLLSEPETEEGGGVKALLSVSEVTEDHQFSDADETDDEENDENEEGDEEASQSSSTSMNTSQFSEDPKSSAIAALAKINKSRLPAPPSPNTASSPIRSLSPGLRLSPCLSSSPRREVSPLRCLSPRLSLSPSPCQSSLSPSNRPVSPFSARHLSPVRAMSPIHPMSPSSPLSSIVGATITVQQRASRHRDLSKTSPSRLVSKAKLEKKSSQKKGTQTQLPPLRPGQTRAGQRVLSHLPLHSQPQASSSSLMIPIGGIQMVQTPVISSSLHTQQSKPNPTMTQTAQAEQGKEKRTRQRFTSKTPKCGSVQGEEFDSKKRDAPSAPLTTWRIISESKERKRMERRLTYIHKGVTIKQCTEKSTDGEATPKSTWKERASRVAEKNKSERRL